MSSYQYSPLPSEGDNIRLLCLLPSEDEAAVLQCELRNYSLQESDTRTHLYEALSYVWGDPSETIPICVNGVKFFVTVNLHAALSHLRGRLFQRIVWVDAICINQTNLEERKRQVQLMAKIYSKAHRVIVWLGKETEDAEEAFEDLHLAAGGEPGKHIEKEMNQQAIFQLLRRPWFQRIWVLQEVAAAQHIVIMCGSLEISGKLFCLGLKALSLSYTAFPELQTFPSVIYLMERAGLRPKYTKSSPKRFFLEIRSLAELVDMFHAHEASDVHDKVYALLGMSSDDPGAAGLQPDYEVSWGELFQKLVKFILGEDPSVETSDYSQRAVIKSKGCVLGQVSSIKSEDRQYVTIKSRNAGWHLGDKKKCEWILQASANSIQKGDIVCLLYGGSKPTIIRLCKDHFIIVVIAVTPLNESEDFKQLELSKPRDFLLVWDLGKSLRKLKDGEEYETLIQANSQLSEYSQTQLEGHLEKPTRIWNVALVLGDLRQYEEAGEKLQEAINRYAIAIGEEHPQTLNRQYGLTPLSWAAWNGYIEVVKQLLAKDSVDPDLKDSQYDRTPLSWAAQGGKSAIVQLLLDTGKVEVDLKDKNDQTPLFLAAQGGNSTIVQLLLDTGKAEPDPRDQYSQTPLYLAAQGGHISVVDILLRSGEVDINKRAERGWTSLSRAAKKGHLAIVERLLQQKADANAAVGEYYERTALQAASEGGHLAIIERLLQEKADVNAAAGAGYNGRTALQAASEGGHLAIIERLLQEKADVNAAAGAGYNGRTALQAASEEGHLAIVERLLQEKADVNAATGYNGRTALQAASEKGHLAIVERLLQEKADVNAATGYNGRTALQAASEKGHLAIVERLLQEKADVNAVAAEGWNGKTALQAASENGHLAIKECLLKAGAIK